MLSSESPIPPPAESHKHHRRRITIVLAAVLCALGLTLAPLLSALIPFTNDVRALSDGLEDPDIETALEKLDTLDADTKTMAWKASEAYPVIGADFRQIRTMVSQATSAAHEILPDIKEPLQNLLRLDFTLDTSTLTTIATIGSKMEEPLSELASNWRDMSPLAFEPFEERIAPIKRLVIDGSYLLENLSPLLTKPEILQGPYLVVALTNSEVLSLGGHPGAWMQVSIDADGIDIGEMHSVTEVAAANGLSDLYTKEEKALFPYLKSDFPSSPFEMPQFQRAGDGASYLWNSLGYDPVQGVVAIDPICLQGIVESLYTPELELSDGQTLPSEKVAEALLNTVYLEYSDNPDQDAYFSEVMGAVLRALQLPGSINVAELVEHLADAIRNGHLMLYSTDNVIENELSSLPIGGDKLANLTGGTFGLYLNDRSKSKLAFYLDKKIVIDGNHVKVTLTNNVSKDEAGEMPSYIAGSGSLVQRTECDMVDLVYLYAPIGGSIQDVEVDGTVSEGVKTIYLDHILWRGILWLLPGETLTLSFTAVPAPDYSGQIELDSSFVFNDLQLNQ